MASPAIDLSGGLVPKQSGQEGIDLSAGLVPSSDQAPPSLWQRLMSELGSRQLLEGAAKPTGQMPGSFEGHPENIGEYVPASAGEIAGGIKDVGQGRLAHGAHRIIAGTGSAVAPMAPFLLPGAAAAPITTALSVGGGALGQKGGQKLATALGASPDQAELAGDVGGLAGGYAGAKLPALGSRAALLGKTPEGAYRSALKPSTTISPAKTERMIATGLRENIPVSAKGVDKISGLIDDLNDQITQKIGSGQGVTIDPRAVARTLPGLKAKFATQVNPEADLNAIDAARTEFLKNNPNPIPAADAQAMKQGTYRQLKGKAYGELKSSAIEAQKALARGIKEELASQFPELGDLNAREGGLLDLTPTLEKAVQRIGNHQLLGIGTPITAGGAKLVTGSNKVGAVAGLMKAVLDNPGVKSKLAIALHQAGVSGSQVNARILAVANGLGEAAANNSQQ
jgi:hypothetical protein